MGVKLSGMSTHRKLKGNISTLLNIARRNGTFSSLQVFCKLTKFFNFNHLSLTMFFESRTFLLFHSLILRHMDSESQRNLMSENFEEISIIKRRRRKNSRRNNFTTNSFLLLENENYIKTIFKRSLVTFWCHLWCNLYTFGRFNFIYILSCGSHLLAFFWWILQVEFDWLNDGLWDFFRSVGRKNIFSSF